MVQYLWVALVVLTVIVKAASTNIQFAMGLVIPWLVLGLALSPSAWLVLRTRFKWRWYHWLNSASVFMVLLLAVVSPLLHRWMTTQIQ